jgi:tight adherence protein C
MSYLTPWIVVLFAFCAVAAVAFVIGQFLTSHVHLQRRATSSVSQGSNDNTALLASFNALVSSYFDEKRFGVQGTVRNKLRRDLVRAGYFRLDAVNYYIFIKLAVVIVIPIVAFLITETFYAEYRLLIKLLIVCIATGLAILCPDAYIARRHRILTDRYRTAFPDLLDLMVVCVDAGLSLDASIDRLSKEILKRNRELGMNLLLLEAEIRAGRATPDALEGFADRLGLDEARSFVGTLRQSIELGTDVGDALRTFSDEMRDRRLLRAEERANKLPVKMVLPLGACIFPVILMVVMLPIILKLMTILK